MTTIKTISKTTKLYKRILTEAVAVERHSRDDGYMATKGDAAAFNAFYAEKIGTAYMRLIKVTDQGNGTYHVTSPSGWSVVTI